MKRMKPALERQKDLIRIDLHSKCLDKKTFEYLFVQTVTPFDFSFNLK